MHQPHLTASAWPASAAVFTDRALWRLVISFQRGLPVPLYQFWLAHEPAIADSQDADLIVGGRFRLTTLLVEHGTLHQLETMNQLVFHCPVWRHALEPMMIDSVISDAIRFHRADMLEWAIVRHKSTHARADAHGRDSRVAARDGGAAPRQSPGCDRAPPLLPAPQAMRARHKSTQQQQRQTLSSWWEEALKNYRDGDLQVLDVLRKHAPLAPTELQRFLQTTKDVPLMQWLDRYFPGAWEPWLIQLAAREGNAELVSYFLEHHPTLEFPRSTFEEAYAHRHWPVVRCIMEKKPTMVTAHDVHRMVCEGEPEAIELLRGLRGFHHQVHESIKDIIRYGQLDVFQRIMNESLLPADATFSIDGAASEGKLDVIQFLTEKGLATATTEAMDCAAECWRWDVVQYLHANRSEGCTTRAMDAAAAQGKIEFVKLFHTERSEGCTFRAMRQAAANGYLDVVQFLHEHGRSEGCTTQAMDYAASLGHLHLVQFLHEHRSEGCTTEAMDDAAAQGHLRVVEYLHAHRTEGCTVAAVRDSVQYCHVQVVRFLFQHYRSLFGPEQLHDLLLRGTFEIWTALGEEYPEQANAVVESALFEAGKQAELETIRFIVVTLGRRDIAHVAMDGAAKHGYNANSQLLRAVFAITGTESVRLSAVRNATEAKIHSDPVNLKFLISVCCEDGARELAIELLTASRTRRITSWSPQGALQAWQPVENEFEDAPMHPFLSDARCPSWAVQSEQMGVALPVYGGVRHDPFRRVQRPLPWAILAINRGDRVVVEMLRDLHERDPNASQDATFSLEGARAAAIRNSNLPLLQWLLDNVDVPVERTLLDEALYYHQYEIAEWLASHCPEGCREIDWENKPRVPQGACSLDQELLDWIESNEAVRSVVDFGGLASHAAAEGELELLEQVYACHPEAVLARGDLQARARDKGHSNEWRF